MSLKKSDPAVYKLIKQEEKRQQEQLSMIPSENWFSPAVREAVGSVFSHKYSEGNVGHRYYEGNANVDALETLAIERTKKAFKLPKDWDVNVQALSGSNANVAVYLALLQMGDTIMGMYLPDGGHLSHGWSYEPGKPADINEPVYEGGSKKVNITSRMFKTVQYKTSPKNQQLDYKEIEKIAVEHKPKLIIAGGTAYPRLLDHKKMAAIAKKVGAYYLADIAHEAGLIAAGVIPSPVGIADVVTLTTHKTLRSGRGAIIMAPQELIKKINKAVLPGLQGGPHNHNIAGIAVGLGEALKPSYKTYAKQIIANTQTLAKELQKYDFQLVSGGADKHLILIDLTNKPVLGRPFSRALAYANIIANFNTMPQETRSPADPSALRLGTPWLTTRGMKGKAMKQIAKWMNQVMEIVAQYKDLPFKDFDKKVKADKQIKKVAQVVTRLCKKFPLEM
jgi:glycine hydroxymethyltransferase